MHKQTESSPVGLSIESRFCPKDLSSPFEAHDWLKRKASIKDDKGKVIFEQEVDAPKGWSDQAVNVVASKYFYGDAAEGSDPATGGRENSVAQLVDRVAGTIARWGKDDGYFATSGDARRFHDELVSLLLGQYGSFNSPVWFNVGLSQVYGLAGSRNGWVWWDGRDSHGHSTRIGQPTICIDAYARPQCSACFIISVADDMGSILDRAKTEGMLFKYGSGTGSDNSTIRSTREKLSSGGRPSGPVSFMRIYDAVAGQIKSGGAVRRAAKMETLKVTHPDIMEFIGVKAREDAKAKALVAAGYSGGMNGESAATVAFQNSNLSVRATDDFMRKAIDGAPWETIAVTTGRPVESGAPGGLWASEILYVIAEGTWSCGDPGLQYEDTIQRWHTCPNTAPINSSNPCCFVGETLVRTSEGKLPIARLEAMAAIGVPLPMAFAFDFEAGVPVLRPIKHAWKAGEAWELIEVRTDKGLVLRCTPEHRFYLRSGEAIEARDLRPGQRLRKIGRSRIGKDPRASIETKEGTSYQNRWMWEQAHGPIPEGQEVHHKNEDRWDDRLSNFELQTRRDHRQYHAAGSHNPRFLEVDEATLVEVWEAVEANPKRTHKSGPAVTPARWNTHVRSSRALKGRVPLAGSPTIGGRIQGMTWAEFAAWIEDRRSLVNDRVESVERVELEAPVAVFDIEVEGVHNFGVTGHDVSHDIVVSNSEYMFIDDSACNLASLNLMKFRREDGSFDVDRFRAACRIFIIAQDTLVDRASYPTEAICRNSHDYRPLGLGYCGLGALLMAFGIPYDSDEGRSLAGAITAIMHGAANLASIELARFKGHFAGYEANREPMLAVMERHAREAIRGLKDCRDNGESEQIERLWETATGIWSDVTEQGPCDGFRNAQATVLAPTGTIAFMMDSGHSTGMEPSVALVQNKQLAGGGSLRIVNPIISISLDHLGYDVIDIAKIRRHVEEHGTVEDVVVDGKRASSGVNVEHLAVFDCAFSPSPEGRTIAWRGHLKMMAALQPFLSGAISKTVNLPASATVEDVRDAYIEAWRLGIKAVAIFRDGSKESQPVTAGKGTTENRSSGGIDLPSEGIASPAGSYSNANEAIGSIARILGLWDELPALGHDGIVARVAEAVARLADDARIEGVEGGLAIHREGARLANDSLVKSSEEIDALKAEIRSLRLSASPRRERLPATRQSLTHKLAIVGNHGEVEAYLTAGQFPDGRPGELFVTMAKEGSTLGGLMDAWATAVSIMLQYGIPLSVIVEKFSGGRFDPMGPTRNSCEIPFASSLVDYVARWLGMNFLPGYREENAPKREIGVDPAEPGGDATSYRVSFDPTLPVPVDVIPVGQSVPAPVSRPPLVRGRAEAHGPICTICGSMTIPTGRCWTCSQCGTSVGGCG